MGTWKPLELATREFNPVLLPLSIAFFIIGLLNTVREFIYGYLEPRFFLGETFSSM